MSIELAPILLGFFGGSGIVILLVLWFIHDFEQFQKFFAYILRYISWINKNLEYNRTANEMQGIINTGQKSINRKVASVLPHAVKIEFVKNAVDVETYLRKGEVIVTMRHNKDDGHNLSIATLAYVIKDLVPNSRIYVDKLLMRATDFTVTKDILTLSKHKTGVSVLLGEIIGPELEGDNDLRTNYSMLNIINYSGEFYQIFLMQLKLLGDKLFPSIPNKAILNEVKEFANFLAKIAQRKRGEDLNLDFIKNRIRVKMLLIAKEETMIKGPTVYDRSVRMAHSEGAEYIYMCAWGAENCQFAKEVARIQEISGRLKILNTQSFEQAFDKGPKTSSICIECAVNLRLTIEDSLESPGSILKLLEQNIAEVREGKIEVCAIGREPGILTKIAVREIESGIDAVGCIKNNLNVGELATILRPERMHVVRYFEDPIKMIVAALTPLEESDVNGIELNKKKRIATVVINEKAKQSQAIGRNGSNIRTACKLTGWKIRIHKGK